MKIALISDTHSFLGSDVVAKLKEADEVWHAGDIGDLATLKKLESIISVRAVYGNIDDAVLRRTLPLDQIFSVGGLKVFMTHIGGYPGRYVKRAYNVIDKERPDVFISGHSHILKIMRDKKFNLLHMNPGACGIKGLHKFRTMIRFDILDGGIQNLQAIDFGLRGRLSLT